MIRICEINRVQIFVVVKGNGIKFGSDRSKIKQGNVESSQLMNFIISSPLFSRLQILILNREIPKELGSIFVSAWPEFLVVFGWRSSGAVLPFQSESSSVGTLAFLANLAQRLPALCTLTNTFSITSTYFFQ